MDTDSHRTTRPRSAKPPTIQQASMGSVSTPSVPKTERVALVCVGQISTFAVLDPAVRCETEKDWTMVNASCVPESKEQVYIKSVEGGPSIGKIDNRTGAVLGPLLNLGTIKSCMIMRRNTIGVSDQCSIAFAFLNGL